MIAFSDGMPLVTLPDGESTTFDKRWIISSIRNAAEQAGYHRWCLAEDIAESISLYLKRDFLENRVDVPNLQEAVLSLLQTLGFQDVAGHFRLPDPPVRLSLTEIAREAGAGYELAFFGLLAERLQRAAVSHAIRIEISNLPGCLRLLARSRRKTPELCEEIVEFIRQHGAVVRASRHGAPLEIALS